MIAEDRMLSSPERNSRLLWKKKALEVDSINRSDLMQKSRVGWNVDGDENTKFFMELLIIIIGKIEFRALI